MFGYIFITIILLSVYLHYKAQSDAQKIQAEARERNRKNQKIIFSHWWDEEQKKHDREERIKKEKRRSKRMSLKYGNI